MTRDWLGDLLQQLQDQLHLQEPQTESLHTGSQTPWWLSALLGLAAWVSSILFIVSFLGPWLALIEGAAGRSLAGVLLILAALWLFTRRQPFTNQVGLALSLTGQGLLVFVLAEQTAITQDSLRPVALASMLLAGVLLWLPSSFLHRHVCALLVLAGAAVLLRTGTALAVYGVLLAAAACTLWLCRQRWATHPQAARIRALVDAATLMSLILAAMPHEQLVRHLLDSPLDSAGHGSGIIYQAGMGMVLLGVVARLVRQLSGARYWALMGITSVLALLAHSVPGLLLSLALGLALFHASNRSWLILMPAFTAFYLFVLYYSLHISLLHKSLLLIACGAVLLAGARLLHSWRRGRT